MNKTVFTPITNVHNNSIKPCRTLLLMTYIEVLDNSIKHYGIQLKNPVGLNASGDLSLRNGSNISLTKRYLSSQDKLMKKQIMIMIITGNKFTDME